MKITTSQIMRLIDASLETARGNYEEPANDGRYWKGQCDALALLKNQIESGAAL